MQPFEWVNARSAAAAANSEATTVAAARVARGGGQATHDAVVIKAGGLDLLDLMKAGLLQPRRIVNLRDIAGLDRIIEEKDGTLRIGAMITIAQVASNPIVRRRYTALADATGNSASPQIRNVATLGGNLLQRPHCWYFRSAVYHCLRKGGDHCYAIPGENQYHAVFDNAACAIVHPSTAATVLVALGATVELTNADGVGRRVLLEDFFVAPDSDLQRENDLKRHEILTAIVLPAPPAGLRMAHLKQGERDSFDWPLADVAVVLEFDHAGGCRRASIVLGAAAPVPHRSRAAEAALNGRRIDDSVARDAAHAALDGATPLAKNAYKLQLFEVLVRRAVLAAMAGP